MKTKTKTNFAITHVNAGWRFLTLGNHDGHFPTEAAANDWMQKSIALGRGGLACVLNPEEMASLKVLPVECYDHVGRGHDQKNFRHGGCGDAIRTVFEGNDPVKLPGYDIFVVGKDGA